MQMSLAKTKRSDTNVSDAERVISVIGGGSLLAYGLTRRDKPGIGLALLGSTLLYRGVTGHSVVYQALGINMRRHDQPGTGRGIGVPYELGFRVDHTIRISKPREEVYRFWRHFENLPRFMDNLQEVKVIDDRHSRWTAKAPAGMSVSWDAEIINETPNELIGWRTLPGSQVDMGGSIRFSDAPGGGTEVKVEMQYNPPAGTVGRTIAKIFAQDPADQIREDLQCFKQLMETGTITLARSEKQAKPGPLRTGETKANRLWDRDQVVEASEESFPASDSPSWTPEKL